MKIKCILILIFVFHHIFSAWYHTDWPFRQIITNITPAISESLSDYPLLVHITNTANPVFSRVTNNFTNILFTGSDGATKLNHEIEYYTNTGELAAWVRLDTLTAGATNTLYMYYRNTAAADQQDKKGVWDKHTYAVYHMSESANSNIDSSTNSRSGVPVGGVTFGQPGKIGKGTIFDGSTGYLNAGACDIAQFNGTTGKATLEVWANVVTLAHYNVVSERVGGIAYYAVNASGGGIATCMAWNGANTWPKATVSITNASWHYVVFIIEGGVGAKYYINSVPTIISDAAYELKDNYTVLKIGSGVGSWFEGTMDEYRISTNARSESWVKANYLYTVSNSSYVQYDSELPYIAIPSLSATPMNVAVTMPVLFSNTSAGYCSVTNVIFNFADGSTVTNTGSSVTNTAAVTFTTAGVKTNWITITDNGTTPVTSSNSLVLNVSDYVLPKLDLYWVPKEPAVGQYVIFIANSSVTYGAITNWRIDFGTGSKYIWRQYMTNHPVSYRYPYSGEFTVRFSVVDQNGYSNTLTLTNNVTDFGARDVTKMAQRVFKYGRDFPLYFKYRLTGEARKVQLRVIHMNGMILRNLGFIEGFEGEDLIFTWDGKTQWNTYLTYPPCFLRYDVYSEDGFIETKIEIMVVY